MTKKIAALALLAALVLPVSAIELSLEENKAERGNIGYLDMQRLFKTFPETLRARENFEELVRQAEEQLNLRKTDLLRLRNDLAQLKIQRDFIAKTPIEVPVKKIEEAPKPAKPAEKAPEPVKAAATPAPAPAPAPAPILQADPTASAKDKENAELNRLLEQAQAKPTPAAAVPPPQVPAPAAAAQAPVAPVGRRDAEPETDLTRPTIGSLPGFQASVSTSLPSGPSTPPLITPFASVTPPPAAPAPAPVVAPAPAPAPTPAPVATAKREPLIINIPGVSTAPIVVTPPTAPPQAVTPPVVVKSTTAAMTPAVVKKEEPVAPAQNPALAELDSKIAVKEKELLAKELEFKELQAASEKNLIDLESRKTEMLLGKIHRAVQEIARREHVSVIVDKSSILYGHDAVDLTDKVMKYLKGS